MFIKNFQILFSSLLFLGSLIAISSNSWFTCWLGLEINLMSMIPLMLINSTTLATEAAIKYFLAQALASIMLIFSMVLNLFFSQQLNLEMTEIFIFLALIMKAGLAPLHFWFPQVSANLKWLQCLILFTWQKVAPLLLLCSFSFNFIMAVSMTSALAGALGGLNQTVLKLMLTYSSISHGGWMLMNCFTNFKSWVVYFSIYTFLSFSIISFFVKNKIYKISNIFSNSDSYINKMIIIMNIFSLGGLPPLLGFTAKLSVILTVLKLDLILVFFILILSSIISLFYYTRITYSNMMNLNSKLMFNPINQQKSGLIFHTMSVALNISAPFIFILF
uniref:NADH-ubiquinone oxidoreductase chain 2 n=1 Tax=Sinella curviseta TaxID=187695 RepID=A0A4P6DCU8_9HEXA|nr:NADH dehydrogenase subunit 2 [Sinella curviseta]QAU56466.1 NADH dehydrogenase subunit 2 [Sinella curviseta]